MQELLGEVLEAPALFTEQLAPEHISCWPSACPSEMLTALLE